MSSPPLSRPARAAPARRPESSPRDRDGPPSPGVILIPIQPSPTLVRVVHFRVPRGWVTAIMRHWRPGESGRSGRCRLCPVCTAHDDGCLKVVTGKVSREDARLLDTTGDPRQRGLSR